MLFGTIATLVSLLLLGFEFSSTDIAGIHLSNIVLLFVFLSLLGWGMGTAAPAANNACIELMPEKVATITGLRGMFRTVGGALGVSLITIILHSTSDLGRGFKITFVSFGLGLLFAIPLVFFMPAGKKEPKI